MNLPKTYVGFLSGISNQVGVDEMRGIVTDPDETHMFFSPTFDTLSSIRDNVLSQLCFGGYNNDNKSLKAYLSYWSDLMQYTSISA